MSAENTKFVGLALGVLMVKLLIEFNLDSMLMLEAQVLMEFLGS